MSEAMKTHFTKELEKLKTDGLFKRERKISSTQGGWIEVDGKKVMNLCANNYLGLASEKDVLGWAKEGVDRVGYGMASVRFICGTETIHSELEAAISAFLGTEDTILYSSCFDANTGLFETLLSEEDAIISDELNHASIIDGIRLAKAKRLRYKNGHMEDLEAKLKEASSSRFRLIATDGVFSMDGSYCKLPEIISLAQKYGASLMVDDSHAIGFVGESGRGTIEHFGALGKVDLITGTLGKALGGASGGYVSGRKELIAWLRQRSRPYLFSNSLSPLIAYVSLRILEQNKKATALRSQLRENAQFFRTEMTTRGFDLLPGEHPIIPIMIYDAALASQIADDLLREGVYVIGFSYPVVPMGKARIRTQMSAAHTLEDLKFAISAFERVGKKHQII